MTEPRRRKFWGWGYEDEGATEDEKASLAAFYAERFGADRLDDVPPPREDEFDLPKPRIKASSAVVAMRAVVDDMVARGLVINDYGLGCPLAATAHHRACR